MVATCPRRGFGTRTIRGGAAGLALLIVIGRTAVVVAADGNQPPDQPRFEHVRGSDELRDPRVMSIAQDGRGFMWFGTFSGLVRYDGYEFRWFVHDPRDDSSLSDNRIRDLLVDSDGALWVGTSDVGLNRFDPETNQFTRYRHDPRNPDSLDDNRIRSLCEDRKGFLWVGTVRGLNRLDRRTGRVVRYPAVTTRAGQVYAIEDVIEDAGGNLWVGAYGWGLVRLSPDGQVLASYRHDPARADSLSDDRVMHLAIDEKGILWVATWAGGLNALNAATGTFRVYRHNPADEHSIPADELRTIWSDRHGIWVIPTRGSPLARLDPVTGRFTRYWHDASRVGSPSPSLSGAALVDSNGSLWLGTTAEGVEVWHPAKPRLTHYVAVPGKAGGLSDSHVLSVLQDRSGGVWLATARGLNRLDVATERFTVYQHEATNPKSLAASIVFALHESRDGVLWVGTWGGGLNQFDPRTRTFRRYPCRTPDPRSLSDCDVWSIHEDRSGRLWIGTYNGLNQLDRQRQLVTRYDSRPGDSSSLSSASIHAITETPDGTLWVGTNNGFDRLIPESGTFARYMYDPADPAGLVHQTVTAMLARPDGSLWLGTGGGLQLVEWDKTGAPRYTLYAERVGLPRFSVRGIVTDGSGALWITTFGHGLWNLDPVSGRTAHFDVTDGLLRGYENRGWMMSDGRLLLGGIDGVALFDPRGLSTPTRIPPIAVTRVSVDNRLVPAIDTVTRGATPAEAALTLRPENRTVSFQFAALDYLAPNKNRFRYRLEGYDDQWTDAGADERNATYTNLSPGTYHFRVIGANAAGIWNQEGATIRLSVLPPWWRTGWFRALALVAVSGLVFGTHRLRVKYVVDANRRLVEEIEERRKAEEQIRLLARRLITAQEAERSHIARDLHDDIGQRVASFSIGLSRVRRQVPAADAAHDALSGLQAQAKELAADLRRISHDLHPSTLEHLGLLRSLRTRCQEFSAETGLAVQVDVADTWPDVTDAVALCLYRVAQEALRNVATHARAAHLTISLDRQPGYVTMTVADDGCGFDTKMPSGRPGLGLVSMLERVRTLGGALDIATKPGAGTKLTVSLPLGEADAAPSTPR